MDKQDEMILFRAFNTLLNFQECEDLDSLKELQNNIENPNWSMINSEEFMNYFKSRYELDIE